FFDGSVRIALRVDPPFQHFVFIEKDRRRYTTLKEALKNEFPEIYNSGKVQILKQDANIAIQSLLKTSSPDYRAVLFLDPYGMQISWTTIESIAASQIIDLLILFPIGMGVNRLLRKDGKIRESERHRLNDCFGSTDWESKFYEQSTQLGLFSPSDEAVKTASFETIANHYNDRLKAVFAAVAANPLFLRNSKNSSLYALCFAASNEKGAPIAVRIASHIFKKASR
ncbi:MAG: three-Cys-motif partner protein TcmP, partial [Terriglobia bacterium]